MDQTYAVTYATHNADDEAIGAATCGHTHATLDEANACAGRLQRAGTIRHLDTDEWEVTALNHQTASIVIVSDDENRWGADRAQLLAALEAQGWQEVGVGLWREPERETDEDGEDDPFDAPYTRLCRAVPPLPGLGPDDVEATGAALLAGAEGFGWVVSRGLWEGLA